MFWITRLLAVVSLALALPKVSVHPASGLSELVEREAGLSNTGTPRLTTIYTTKLVLSTYTIDSTLTTIVASAVNNTATPGAPTTAGSAMQYVTVTATSPVYQTVTTDAGQVVETIYETVTNRIPARTSHVLVMYVTSVSVVVVPTKTQVMPDTGVATPGAGLAERDYSYGGTVTLGALTSVAPIGAPSTTSSHQGIDIIPASSVAVTDTGSPASTTQPASTAASSKPDTVQTIPASSVPATSLDPPGTTTHPNTVPIIATSSVAATNAGPPSTTGNAKVSSATDRPPSSFHPAASQPATSHPATLQSAASQSAATQPVAQPATQPAKSQPTPSTPVSPQSPTRHSGGPLTTPKESTLPLVSTVYTTVRPTITTTSTLGNPSTITSYVTITVTETSGVTTVSVTSPTALTVTNYAVYGIYPGEEPAGN